MSETEENKKEEQKVEAEEAKKPVPASESGDEATTEAKEDKKSDKKKTGRTPRSRNKKAVRQVPVGRAYIKATYNNTIVSITDPNGNVIGWSSAGKMGFRGPKKSTPYAATVIVKDIAERLEATGLKEVAVFVKGIGSGRESAIRALNANGINVSSIKDVTPIPHNGCRPPKPRRV